ncbi:YeeE/YedE family protein [Halobacteriovorax marinus]|uniref:YeeE/YedE family protein n=1 Tax=Halobacteriovorax marinus TaxID=97084 RepID=A0A1Y5F4N4_9BACT|nr:YeeE/YedE family protein [Halobacteriovorax marinus]
MSNIISLLSGIIFAIGLGISGMVNPQKVIGFLDLFGNWDYALAFVMGGAVVFNLITFKFIIKKNKPVFASELKLPTSNLIDKKLILGSIMFGAGWGIIGMCPGPAIVNLVLLDSVVITFVLSMTGGMLVHKLISK